MSGSAIQRPLVVDLYCGAGGVGLALEELGFNHIGVDVEDFSETYPGEFIQADASRPPINHSPELLWLSPPCTAYSTLSYANKHHFGYDDPREFYPTFDELRVREVIEELDPTHYIIENVPTCEDLDEPTALNGLAFGKSYDNLRHFETSFPCPRFVAEGEPTVVMNTRLTKSQSAKPLAEAKDIPLEWGEQSIRSAIPREYVQYLLHYCPSTPDVPLPDGVQRQGMLTEVIA